MSTHFCLTIRKGAQSRKGTKMKDFELQPQLLD